LPATQPNWNYFTYESDDGTDYNIRARAEWATVTEHGLSARVNGQPRYIASAQQQPRKAIYRDTTTGRSYQGPVGTAAAYTALAIGDTITVPVQGLATAVTYTLVKKVGEKVPTTIVGTQLADHA